MKKKEHKTPEQELQEAGEKGLINAQDVQAVFEFIDSYGTLNELSTGSRKKYFFSIGAFLREIGGSGHKLESLDEARTMNLIKFLQAGGVRNKKSTRKGEQTKPWSEATKEDYWKRWCKFYEWVHERRGENWNPGAVRLHLDAKKKYRYKANNNLVEKKSILTPEEMLQLIYAETNLCYKVFFSVVYEGGLRFGEAASLKVCDVEKNGNGYKIQLRASKTVKRPVHLVQFSTAYLGRWLEQHPLKHENAPLFTNTKGEPLQNEAVNKKLRELAERTGLKKPKLSMHSLRHSRATALCQHINEFEMRKIFGWAPGSRMPEVYIRSEAIDELKALKKAAGLGEKEEAKQTGRVCLHCRHINPYTAEYCDNCNLPLDAEKLQRIKTTVDAVKVEEAAERMIERLYPKLLADIEARVRAG